MGNRNFIIIDSDKGQSTVEYILLLAVVMSLVYLVVNSERFKDLIGDDGAFAIKMKNESEWNYRFGNQGKDGFTSLTYPNGTNPTYWNATDSSSHFVGPLKPYPSP